MKTSATRLGRVREAFRASSPPERCWWLFTKASDVRWLTGFEGSFGSVLLDCDSGTGVLLTDSRYSERARELLAGTAPDCVVRLLSGSRNMAEAIEGTVGGGTLFVDPAHVTHAQFLSFSSLPCAVETSVSPVGDLRRTKDPEEVDAIRRAAAITDEALRSVVEDGLAGRTERAVALRIEHLMRELGAEAPAFDSIVACGTNASVPHHSPGDAMVGHDDLVIVDVGARVDGYRSDMTRTVVVGSPDAARMGLLDLVTRAQAEGVRTVGVGTECAAVDAACRSVFESHGVGELFIHGVGHGVGLDIHEEPFLTSAPGIALREGEVVTVEPGLYREGLGGARVEDSVLVTSTGGEPLTLTPKDIRCPRSRRTI